MNEPEAEPGKQPSSRSTARRTPRPRRASAWAESLPESVATPKGRLALILGWVTLAVALGLALLPRPAVDNSVAAITATADQRARDYASFRSDFGADEVLVAHLRADRLPELTEAVASIESLFGELAPITRVLGPTQAYGEAMLLLEDPDLFDAEARARVERELDGPLGRTLHLLTLSPPTATIYGFGLLAPPEVWRSAQAVLSDRRSQLSQQGVELVFGGSPLLNVALDREGAEVERTALPILVTVCVIFLLITLKSLRLTICALTPVGLLVLAAEGGFGLFGLTGNLVVNVAKPLLFVIGLASALHVVVGFLHRERFRSRADAALSAARDKADGVALALFTTALGFASLALADLGPIRVFGLFAGAGLAAAVPLLLLGLPALLAAFGPPPGRGERDRADQARAPRLERQLVALAAWSRAHRGLVITMALALIAAGLVALPTLHPSARPLDLFPRAHPVRVAHDQLGEIGAGLASLELVVKGRDGPLSLQRRDQFAATATAIQGVRGRVDLALLVREAAYRSSGRRGFPESAYADFLLETRPELAEGLESRGKSRISLLLDPETDAEDLERISSALDSRLRGPFEDISVVETGSYDLIVRSQAGLRTTLVQSLVATLVLMELVLLIALRSPLLALVAIVPNLLPVATNALVMKGLDIPLDVGTAMTGTVALGIAVDDTLHFLVAWKEEGELSALKRTGRALVYSTLVIASGFFALVPSGFLPTHRFALLAGVAILVALIGDLVVLPALLPFKEHLLARDGAEDEEVSSSADRPELNPPS
ncbi:MAG: MMPL family transporter [Myxococcota bacterium]